MRYIARRLRARIAFAGMVIIVLLAALSVLSDRNIVALSDAISVTNQTTGPLYHAALKASDTVQHVGALAHEVVQECFLKQDGHVEEAIANLERTSYADIDRLERHARGVGLGDLAGAIATARDDLIEQHKAMIGSCQAYREWIAARDRLEAETGTLVRNLLFRLDGQVRSATWQRGGVEAGPGRAFVLSSIHAAREQAARLRDSLHRDILLADPEAVRAALFVQERVTDVLTHEIANLAKLIRAIGEDDAATRFQSMADDLRARLTGPDGLHALIERGMDLRVQMAREEAQHHVTGSRLRKAVHILANRARLMNEQAIEAMNGKVGDATFAIHLLAGAASLTCAIAIVVFGIRVVRPIELLTAHIRRIQVSERHDVPIPAGLCARRDEIGVLASSFAAMTRSLEEARQRLLQESRAEVRQQFERLSSAIESIPQGILLTDASRKVILCNENFRKLYGLDDGREIVGQPVADVIRACLKNGASVLDEPDQSKLLRLNYFLDGQKALDLNGERTVVVTAGVTPEGGTVSVHEDITERRRQEERIAHLAHHDALTGLANRVLFREEACEALLRRRKARRLALLYIDLDQFKAVNDTLGHPTGDRLLVEVAKRLRAAVGRHDHVARLGGDEFAIMLAGNPRAEDASAAADRLIETIRIPYEVDGNFIVVGASVGIAMAPDDGTDADVLMKHADMALYRAKQDGRNTYCFFESDMDARMQARRELELDLRKALEGGEFALHYQPLFDIGSHEVVGFEALLRWTHPVRGNVSPADFIPIAEETGLIGEIGSWVVKEACREAATWPKDVRVAVNISPVQFRTRTLMLDIMAALASSGLLPSRLEIEITEGVLLQDTDATLGVLEDLRRLGIRIAMDDFGTGYSSLSYLRKFNFDKVKIDRSFIQDIGEDAESRAVIRAVTSLCLSLGITTTAEGVETEDQLRALKAEGCTQAQGFLTGRPMPAADAVRLLQGRAAATVPAAAG
ncbi:putative bifunctional diguanylate cyclase/phosphodiesterase [Polymorphum gilvum]|nr:EAL domain-containing protein [Polymorphum gilvum]